MFASCAFGITVIRLTDMSLKRGVLERGCVAMRTKAPLYLEYDINPTIIQNNK